MDGLEEIEKAVDQAKIIEEVKKETAEVIDTIEDSDIKTREELKDEIKKEVEEEAERIDELAEKKADYKIDSIQKDAELSNRITAIEMRIQRLEDETAETVIESPIDENSTDIETDDENEEAEAEAEAQAEAERQKQISLISIISAILAVGVISLIFMFKGRKKKKEETEQTTSANINAPVVTFVPNY